MAGRWSGRGGGVAREGGAVAGQGRRVAWGKKRPQVLCPRPPKSWNLESASVAGQVAGVGFASST